VHLAQPAQEILGHSDWVMITERVDEVARRIGRAEGFRGLGRPLPRPWTPGALGGDRGSGRAESVTAGAPRHGSGAPSRKGRPPTLRDLSAEGIEPLEGRDDRCSPRLTHGRPPAAGHQIARNLQARSLEVPAWPQDVLRCEAPPVAGDHEVPAGGLGPLGPRPEEPTRPQLTVRMGSLAPLGMPLATEGVAGERAEDGFDLPRIERRRSGWNTPGRRCVGDGQRRAWATRASLARPQDWSWSPWPWTGATAEAMDAGIPAGVMPGEAGACARRGRPHDRGHEGRAAEGDAGATGGAPGGARDGAHGVRSPSLPPPRQRGGTHGGTLQRPPWQP
jgi:hypothetical protein